MPNSYIPVPVRLTIGEWYQLKGFKNKLQLRNVGVRGFNFCDQFQQKKFKDNFYCKKFTGETEEVITHGDTLIFEVSPWINNKIVEDVWVDKSEYFKYSREIGNLKKKVLQHDTVIGEMDDRMGEDRDITVAQCILLMSSPYYMSSSLEIEEYEEDQQKAEELLREAGLLPILTQADE